MKVKIFLFLFFIIFTCFCGVVWSKKSDNYNVILNTKTPSIESDSDEQILFILDYSNSMNEMLVERTKYELLLSSMNAILSKIPQTQNIGIRIYGHRWGLTPLDACRASNLILPISETSPYYISKTLSKYKPRGMTPITYSLKQAVKNDFRGSGEKHIILITDGGENCDESPCKYAMELIKYRKDIRIDVIALNIDNDDDLDQLECTAKVTKGQLYNANTKAELLHSLNKAFRSKKSVDAKILY